VADPIIRHLDVCAGLGLFSLGLHLADSRVRTVGFVERQAYCAALLLARMEDASLDRAPVFCGRVEDLDGSDLRGQVDLLSAGYPCPPYSGAGKGLGDADHRAIWPASAPWTRLQSSSKTSGPLLFANPTPTFEEWASGSVRLTDPCASPPKTSARRTAARDTSCWPTPPASSSGSGNNGCPGDGREEYATKGAPSLDSLERRWPTPMARDVKAGFTAHRQGGRDLADEEKQWPTPMAAEAGRGYGPQGKKRPHGRPNETLNQKERLWPTPTAGDAKASGSRNAPTSKAHQGTSLSDAEITGSSRGRRDRAETGPGGPPRPNPAFRELLMGTPPGWSKCTPLETASFLRWWRLHGAGS